LTESGSGKTGSTPGVYVWVAPNGRTTIHLNLEVVDGVLQDVMRGFGAVPKRGAEVGGILLGSVERRDGVQIHIDGFEPMPIQYKRGPSYLLSEEDIAAFQTAVEQYRSLAILSRIPVGYYRSHTREAAGLGAEDLQVMGRCFPEPAAVALLIRPFASKPSMAGYYLREKGEFPPGPPQVEFPFRRRELAPDEPSIPTAPALLRAERREALEATAPPLLPSERRETPPATTPPPINPWAERTPAPPALPQLEMAVRPPPLSDLPVRREPAMSPQPVPDMQPPRRETAYEPPDEEEAEGKRKGPGWFWLPLSFVFLLVGLMLGYQASVMINAPEDKSDVFGLALTVTKAGDNLYVKWNRQAAAIRTAERGVLIIEDGTFAKTLELDSSQLQNGSVVYRHYSPGVRFMLQVSPNSRDTLTESIEWKE
jgi:hypothetical protein